VIFKHGPDEFKSLPGSPTRIGVAVTCVTGPWAVSPRWASRARLVPAGCDLEAPSWAAGVACSAHSAIPSHSAAGATRIITVLR